MKNYYLKIREKFIDLVKNGTKKHEYRLVTPKRKEIKIGDNLILISNQDKKNYVRTSVKSIKTYGTWYDALNENWQSDFSNLFSSYEESLKECYKYYPKEQVDMYGIIVFEIEPVFLDLGKTSVLIDTNVIIRRESNNNVSFEVSTLFNWLSQKNIKTYIHNCSIKEISMYENEHTKNIILTKLEAYNILPSFHVFQDELFNEVCSLFSKDTNGQIDNQLLCEVYNDNVGLLITDDKLMLQKAEKLYIRDKVLSVSELNEKFEDLYPKNIEYKMLAVKLKKFEEINLQDAFFDTLREDYEGQKFDNWFKRKGDEKAYVFENNEELRGFLYLKTELPSEPDYLTITPVLSPIKRLKVGTFKVNRTGFKLGERFMKIIFDNAVKRDVDEIYVTMFDKRQEVLGLKSLMESWGFKYYGTKNSNGELVLVKSMREYDDHCDPKFNYPIIKESANKYFLPIKAEYHTDLFPDKILKNENMRLYEDSISHRYAIEKIYLSGAYNISAKKGDVVLIYRMSDRINKHYASVVTGLAIVQDIINPKDENDCINICKDRSIFTVEDIRENYKSRKTIIKLLDYLPFNKTVNLAKLRELGIIDKDKGPRQFTKITQEQYEKIYQLGMEDVQ